MKFLLDNSAFSILNCQRKFQLRVVEGKDEHYDKRQIKKRVQGGAVGRQKLAALHA